MEAWFRELHPVLQALMAGGFTWLLTLLGAATVFLSREMPRALLDSMLGFAAGVMIAASFWSLLAPAIELAEGLSTPGWVPASVGFLLGAAFLRVTDEFLPHLHPYLRSRIFRRELRSPCRFGQVGYRTAAASGMASCPRQSNLLPRRSGPRP